MADKPAYCNLPADTSAVQGKDILITIWDSTGSDFLAIAGQQGLTLNRSAETLEVAPSKTSVGGWKQYLGGAKEWSVDTDGLYALGDTSHKALQKAFEDGAYVCVRIVKMGETPQNLFGGLALVTDYPIEAPYDDAATFSATLTGSGALVDLTEEEQTPVG